MSYKKKNVVYLIDISKRCTELFSERKEWEKINIISWKTWKNIGNRQKQVQRISDAFVRRENVW